MASHDGVGFFTAMAPVACRSRSEDIIWSLRAVLMKAVTHNHLPPASLRTKPRLPLNIHYLNIAPYTTILVKLCMKTILSRNYYLVIKNFLVSLHIVYYQNLRCIDFCSEKNIRTPKISDLIITVGTYHNYCLFFTTFQC